jgi:hypothetical protein
MKRVAIAIVGTLVSSSYPAMAQIDVSVAAKFCQVIQDDTQRLKCFDGLFSESQVAKEQTTSSAPKGWDVKETQSPVDDSPQVTATLDSTSNGPAGLLNMPAVLFLRCKDHKTDAMFGKPMGFVGLQPVKVIARINDQKAIETNWPTATNGQEVFAPSAVQLIQALPDNGTLFLRATGPNNETIEGTFALGTVSAVREKIAAACKWASGLRK